MGLGAEHDGKFPETRWSLVKRIGGSDDPNREKALEEICTIYWPPVYAFLRASGETAHDAEDLTQAFFADFLSRDSFRSADPAKGRLRTYLLSCLKNFLIDEHRKSVRLKRGGGLRPLSLDSGEGEARCLNLATDTSNIDLIFDRQWAITLIENVMLRLRDRYQGPGKAAFYSSLNPYLRVDPDPGTLRSLAAEVDRPEGTIRVALHRLRRRFRDLLEEEVRATLAPGDDFEEEMRFLRSVI